MLATCLIPCLPHQKHAMNAVFIIIISVISLVCHSGSFGGKKPHSNLNKESSIKELLTIMGDYLLRSKDNCTEYRKRGIGSSHDLWGQGGATQERKRARNGGPLAPKAETQILLKRV